MRTVGFNTNLMNGVDYDLALKMSEVCHFYHIDIVNYSYRWHGENTSIKNRKQQEINHFLVINQALERMGLAKEWVAVQADKSNPRSVKLCRKSDNLPVLNNLNRINQQEDFRKKIEILVETNPHQLSVNEYTYIIDTIQPKIPSNFLIFGVGKDSNLWTEYNTEGKTVFLEDDIQWIDIVKQSIPNINVHHVDYQTELTQWQDLLNSYKQGNRDCLSMLLPDEIYQTNWDLIFVDAPRGYGKYPGRMKSIYVASQLAKKVEDIDIFIHDCDRQIEDIYTQEFFKLDNLVNQVEKLRHFKIKNSILTQEKLAIQLLQTGKIDQAISEYNRALQLPGDKSAIYQGLAFAYRLKFLQESS